MGRVFTPESIVANEIPKPGAHEAAGRFIMNQFFEPQEGWTEEERTMFFIDGHGIESGMVYGSTALGKAGIRSDVDVFVNYYPNQSNKAFPLIRSVFRSAEEEYKVPVEPNILHVGALYNSLEHSIDPLFAEHLKEIEAQDDPRWSYNWPVSALVFQPFDFKDKDKVRAVAVRYASGKARHFAKAIVGYRDQADVHVMQRALELPGAIGRKVIAATMKPGETKPDLGNKYTMSELVLKKMEEFAPEWFKTAVDYQQYLTNLDGAYDQLLAAAIDGTSSIDEYRQWIEDNYIFACKMAFEVAHAWSEIVGHKMDTPLEMPDKDTYTQFGLFDIDDIY